MYVECDNIANAFIYVTENYFRFRLLRFIALLDFMFSIVNEMLLIKMS